jgi:flagellar basal body-associated protein FliL
MESDTAKIKTSSEKRPASKLVLLVVCFMLLATAAGAFVWQTRRKSASAAPQEAPIQVIHLESFLVNLGDPSKDCYLRLGIDLGIDEQPSSRREQDHGELPISQIRDTVLGIVMDTSADALLTGSGKADLKTQLLSALRSRLPRLGLREIYFTDFLVQR